MELPQGPDQASAIGSEWQSATTAGDGGNGGNLDQRDDGDDGSQADMREGRPIAPAPFVPASASAVHLQNLAVPAEIAILLGLCDTICSSSAQSVRRRSALERLSMAMRPQKMRADARHVFVQRALEKGVVTTAAELIESGRPELVVAASNFLADLAFGSDVGAQAVLKVFDGIAECFTRIFENLAWEHLPLLESAILLCANIAAMCPSGHKLLIPLVRPVCLRIIKYPRASDKLRGSTITLLANLSTTVGHELRSLRVADVLLDLVLQQTGTVSGPGRSVAESVIIFLHGEERCEEVDRLMAANVVGDYCVPIMELTLRQEEFRGMYPYLMYSARLFQVLSRSREYAEALVAHPKVVPLLLQANGHQEGIVQVESDLEGRRLALEALWSFARFGLWPSAGGCGAPTKAFLDDDLPRLLADDHMGIRGSAAGLWAQLHVTYVLDLVYVGRVLEQEGKLPCFIWRQKVLACLFPFLEADSS